MGMEGEHSFFLFRYFLLIISPNFKELRNLEMIGYKSAIGYPAIIDQTRQNNNDNADCNPFKIEGEYPVAFKHQQAEKK